ncbi:hypothetical protein EV128_1233 [Rhizobium azibense]|nr:hypothetical protein EV128_1233 [Rhizobium azibense]
MRFGSFYASSLRERIGQLRLLIPRAVFGANPHKIADAHRDRRGTILNRLTLSRKVKKHLALLLPIACASDKTRRRFSKGVKVLESRNKASPRANPRPDIEGR